MFTPLATDCTLAVAFACPAHAPIAVPAIFVLHGAGDAYEHGGPRVGVRGMVHSVAEFALTAAVTSMTVAIAPETTLAFAALLAASTALAVFENVLL